MEETTNVVGAARHTPGPWEVNRLRNDLFVEGGIRDGHGVCCQVQLLCDTATEEDFANARLISSAPDLLAACEAILARIEGDFDHPALVKFGPLTNTNNDVREIARAAIAKARNGGGS